MRATFTRAVRAEIRKYLTTRQWWGMGLAVALVAAIAAGAFGALFVYGDIPLGEDRIPLADFAPPLELARLVYTFGASFGYVLTLIIGVLFIGQEYRHQTITSTLLAVPRRGEVIGAKLVGLAVVASANALLYVIVSVLVGGTVLTIGGYPVFPEPPELIRALALVALVLTVWAFLGFAIGVLIRNQIAALLVAVGIAWIVEPLLSVALTFAEWGEGIAPYLPGAASTAALETFTGALTDFGGGPGGGAMQPDQLDWWVATLVLLAYAAVTGCLGYLVTRRRDVG